MSDIVIRKRDDVFLRVEADQSILAEASDFFTFSVPGHRFMPAFRNKQWDGKIRLLNMYTGELYTGLNEYVEKFARNADYSVSYEDDFHPPKVDKKVIADFCKWLNPHSKDKPIAHHDYQIDGVTQAISNNRQLLLSPTSSGKSLMIYTLVRWYEEIIPDDKQILIIVPTTQLVEQLFFDFADYSTHNGWSAEDKCHRVYAGADKNNFSKKVVISTWQSIYKMKKQFFTPFNVLIGDEAHGFKSKSLTSIATKMINCPYKFGTTGTLDGTTTHRLVLEGLFGPVYKVITTKELMDDKKISSLSIQCVVLEYSEEIREAYKKISYQDEIKFLITNKKRNNFIKNLATTQKGNTLVLFQMVEKHGKILHKMIEEKVKDTDRKVFFVSGDTKTKDRELVREITEKENSAIIVASYGTFSTGVNIKNLHNIIFASPSKSRIRNLQSIGRGLRKSDVKDHATLYDIADDLHWKKHKNFTLKHFVERVKIYNSEKFDYKIHKVNI